MADPARLAATCLAFAGSCGARERGLRRVEGEALGQDGVVAALEQGDEARRRR
jgi:hypothetical protein